MTSVSSLIYSQNPLLIPQLSFNIMNVILSAKIIYFNGLYPTIPQPTWLNSWCIKHFVHVHNWCIRFRNIFSTITLVGNRKSTTNILKWFHLVLDEYFHSSKKSVIISFPDINHYWKKVYSKMMFAWTLNRPYWGIKKVVRCDFVKEPLNHIRFLLICTSIEY